MSDEPFKTVQAQTTSASLVKPAELVDVVELTPLKLIDRRAFNLMLGAAWKTISEDVEHSIPKSELRPDSSHSVGERLDDCIGRLMGARVKVSVERDGKPYTLNIPLLETVAEPLRADGNVYYRFPRELRKLVLDSNVFARLRKDVMFALTSKYALALYEMIQKRGNLNFKTTEKFSIKDIRELLGVPNGKLQAYKNFKAKALLPAVTEVQGLADFGVTFHEIKESRSVKTIEISWWKKSEEELKAVWQELHSSKVGRRVRLKERMPMKSSVGSS